MPSTPLSEQSSESFAGEFYVDFRCLSRALLERMEHIDGLHELGDIQDAVLERRVDPNLPDSRPDGWHVFRIQRLQALLDTAKLKPSQSPGSPGKSANVPARAAEPLEPLVGHGSIYKYSYVRSSAKWRCLLGTTELMP